MKHLIFTFALLFSANSFAVTQYVYNVSKNEVVSDTMSDVVRPIASVTKLMTAIVLLESGLNLEDRIPYKGSKFLSRKTRTREELLSLMLIKSDNIAAESLAYGYAGGRDNFVRMMNSKASQIGMLNTSYVDLSGLGVGNKSTAKDLGLLLQYAHQYSKIIQIASMQKYVVVDNTKRKPKVTTVSNTNYRLLADYNEIEISKTGFTNPAGKCLAMFINKNGEQFVVVILGERNTNSVQKVSRNIINSL